MKPQKILIVSNCQVQPLKHGLGNVIRNIEIDTVPVHVISADERNKVFEAHIKNRENYAFVLSVPLSADFGGFSHEKIVDSFYPTPVFTISNLYFTGLLPDICYIGGLNARTPGPIGDYHSQIALLGFLMGLDVAATVRLYAGPTYAYMGFYNEFQASLEEAARRDATADIPIGDILPEQLRRGVCFLSQNHPTSLLLCPYINKIARWLAAKGLVDHSGADLLPEATVNYLAYSTVFPIYPEIAQHHSMPYSGSYTFRTPTIGDVPSRPLGLEEFVAGEHDAFRAGDRHILENNYPGNLLIFRGVRNAEFHEIARSLGAFESSVR